MTARQQWATVLGVVVLFAVTLAAATHFLGDELFPVGVGSEAPPFQAVTLDSVPRTRTLADYKGKVVLLNVWATWCEPCRVEMPSIEKLQHDFGPQGLKVVAISVDDANSKRQVRDFVKEYGLTFDILHDPAKGVPAKYQIPGYPETFIIGREGTIRKKVIGAADWSSDANRALIRELLGDTTSAR
jgi:peroxiredoxin